MNIARNVILIFFVLFFFSSLTRNFFEYQKNMSFYQSYKNDYENEKKKNIELKTQVLKSNDPSEIEKTIRNKLNMLKPSEVSIMVADPTPSPVQLTPTPQPNYDEWWHTFTKN